ncbi:MAG: exosome complex protein Rrp42 [Candidatus Aenigmarchaeota archaeon]|nr:exosome complex protein Rrp42 [Candidatus Aenigmarchaeota archaeon]
MKSNYIIKLLEKNERLDGRKLDEFREITIEKNPIERAEGSARVKMGKTDIIVGVKLELGTPYPDTPDAGVLRTGAEFNPMAHPEFETGPPGEDATEVARVIDRGIRESETIKVEELCIEEGEKVWMVYVDAYPINHDGNLIDAGSLASLVALNSTRMPKLEEDDKINREELKGSLPINHQPITVTVGKVNGKFLVDPTFEEEKVLETKLSIAVTEEDTVVSMQKSGNGPLSDDDVDKMIDVAVKKSKEIRKLISNGKKTTKSKAKANKSGKSKDGS